MAILNRRNALVGWIIVKATKSVVKQKAADNARTGGAGSCGVDTSVSFKTSIVRFGVNYRFW